MNSLENLHPKRKKHATELARITAVLKDVDTLLKDAIDLPVRLNLLKLLSLCLKLWLNN